MTCHHGQRVHAFGGWYGQAFQLHTDGSACTMDEHSARKQLRAALALIGGSVLLLLAITVILNVIPA